MRYVALVAVAGAVFAAVFLAAALAPSGARWPIVDVAIHASKVVALFGCALAAASFARAHHLRRAWALLAVMYALLVVRDAVLYRDLVIDHGRALARWIECAIVIPANAAAVVGTWLLGRAWYVGGIALPGTRTTRHVVRAIAIVMAVAITLPTFWSYAPRFVDGDPIAVLGTSNALADAVGLAMLAPVLLTAIALRGGPIVWPWALLAGSLFGWLIYDVTFALSSNVATGGEALRVLAEAFHVLATLAAAIAGIAQHFVVVAAARAAR